MNEVRKLRVKASALLVGLMVTAGQAMAALPAEATAAFTAVKEDAESMISSGWPILVAVTTGFVLMKLFKRGVNKAT